ncbi:uncharacterized protein DS421_3g83250 [Arachis hypogaea]|nr:uncharacterized protein DS421_3g83250 [Arachis hypogaea]
MEPASSRRYQPRASWCCRWSCVAGSTAGGREERHSSDGKWSSAGVVAPSLNSCAEGDETREGVVVGLSVLPRG